jgi:hypothetical protein
MLRGFLGAVNTRILLTLVRRGGDADRLLPALSDDPLDRSLGTDATSHCAARTAARRPESYRKQF